MSQENVEVVRRVTQAVDTDGFEGALALLEAACDEQVEWIEDPSWPDAGTYRGVEGLRAVLAERTDAFDFDQQTEKLVDAGAEVVAFVQWRGRGQHSGAETDMRLAVVFTLRASMITRVRFYLNRSEALDDVGLAE
jgi:ketosteroid isomerase-like protein